MLLTEIIKNSTSAIQRKRTAQESKQSAEAYAHALTQLNTTSEGLKSTLKCVAALKESKLANQPLISEQIRNDLLECTNNCGQSLFDGSLTSEMVVVLKTKSESFSDQMQSEWKKAAQKYAEGTRSYLSMIAGLSSDPKKANELLGKIKKITDGSLSIDAIDSLVDNVAQAKAITDSFSLNGSIEKFLKKVSAGQATVIDLTPEVQKWLSEKHLSGKLKISVLGNSNLPSER